MVYLKIHKIQGGVSLLRHLGSSRISFKKKEHYKILRIDYSP